MDQDIGMVAVEPRLRGDVRLKDFLDGLEFAEVVAAADAAERGIKGGGGRPASARTLSVSPSHG